MQNKRTCLISKEKLEKNNLFQIKFSPNGKWICGKSGEKNLKGRSVYLKNDEKIFKEFKKRPKNFLENFLERKIDEKNFLELKKIFNGIKNF